MAAGARRLNRPALLRADIVEQSEDGRRLRTIAAGPLPAGGGTGARDPSNTPLIEERLATMGR